MSSFQPSHITIDLAEINRLGRNKYFEDRGVYRNPYPPGSSEHNEFERGWTQALKQYGGDFVQYHPLPAAGVPDAEAQAERYRSRKG